MKPTNTRTNREQEKLADYLPNLIYNFAIDVSYWHMIPENAEALSADIDQAIKDFNQNLAFFSLSDLNTMRDENRLNQEQAIRNAGYGEQLDDLLHAVTVAVATNEIAMSHK